MKIVFFMIQQKHIQVTIHIIIEENSLGAKAREVQGIMLRFVFEIWNAIFVNALANEKLIFAVKGFVISYATHIDIK